MQKKTIKERVRRTYTLIYGNLKILIKLLNSKDNCSRKYEKFVVTYTFSVALINIQFFPHFFCKKRRRAGKIPQKTFH